jgi:hypothetical protein
MGKKLRNRRSRLMERTVSLRTVNGLLAQFYGLFKVSACNGIDSSELSKEKRTQRSSREIQAFEGQLWPSMRIPPIHT